MRERRIAVARQEGRRRLKILIAIVSVLALNLLSDGIRDLLDPTVQVQ